MSPRPTNLRRSWRGELKPALGDELELHSRQTIECRTTLYRLTWSPKRNEILGRLGPAPTSRPANSRTPAPPNSLRVHLTPPTYSELRGSLKVELNVRGSS